MKPNKHNRIINPTTIVVAGVTALGSVALANAGNISTEANAAPYNIKHVPPKKLDPNTTPAGVPGEDHGTPGKPGIGPAGQKPNAEGFVPSELEDPNLDGTLFDDSSPSLLTNPLLQNPFFQSGGQTYRVTPKAEEGVDNGANLPPALSPNTGKTIPTGEPSINHGTDEAGHGQFYPDRPLINHGHDGQP